MSNQGQIGDYIAALSRGNRLARQISSWSSGVTFEIAFWERVLGSGGGQWSDDLRRRMRTDANNADVLYQRLGVADPLSARILDVGAGPLTVLSSTHDGAKIDLVAADPLAPAYDLIVQKHAISRPVATQQAFAEDLTAAFEPASFDAVYCRNALDHSFDPVRGILEMLAVVKLHGRVLLVHNRNEAEREGYTGFHQWNFDSDGDRFIIWTPTERHDVTEILGDVATVLLGGDETWVDVAIIKNAAGPTGPHRHRGRVQALLQAFLVGAMSNFGNADELARNYAYIAELERFRDAQSHELRTALADLARSGEYINQIEAFRDRLADDLRTALSDLRRNGEYIAELVAFRDAQGAEMERLRGELQRSGDYIRELVAFRDEQAAELRDLRSRFA
jgi:SAM-dependent methyltransferase